MYKIFAFTILRKYKTIGNIVSVLIGKMFALISVEKSKIGLHLRCTTNFIKHEEAWLHNIPALSVCGNVSTNVYV